MSHALLAIHNILQNLNIFIGSRETVLFTPIGSKKVNNFQVFRPLQWVTLSVLKKIGQNWPTIESCPPWQNFEPER